MANRPLHTVLHHLRKVAGLRAGADLADGELLERFVTRREEAAFEALLQRHGPMVQAVCQRILNQAQDAEDAFQATFLVLVRKATSVGKPSLKETLLQQDILDVKRELRRIKLARVAAQVRLARHKADQKPGADSQATARKLEEEVLVLTEQEKVLGEDLKQLLREAGQQSASSADVHSFRRELAAEEEMARRLSAEVEALRVNLAPLPRIKLLEEAHAPKGK